jgi:hypothetical protein
MKNKKKLRDILNAIVWEILQRDLESLKVEIKKVFD